MNKATKEYSRREKTNNKMKKEEQMKRRKVKYQIRGQPGVKASP
jgi:hypothetical protein